MKLINDSITLTKSLLFPTIVILLVGCGRTMKTEQGKNSLMDVDRQFSELSVEKGRAVAFDTFMADSAIMYRNNGLPMKGRTEIKEALSKSRGTLQWEPFYADLAQSGDIGYTLGEYEYNYTDSTGHKESVFGNYVTIWRKQSDGSWKFVFDAGNQAPPPEKGKVAPPPFPERGKRISTTDQDR